MFQAASFARIVSKRCANASIARGFSNIKYTASHEFVKIDGEIGTVGITKHASDALGDVVFVDLPSVGSFYKAGDVFGSVESVKAAADVYSPVEGTVIEVNPELESNPGMVNTDPVKSGWFMKLQIANKDELNKLMDQTAYDQHLENDAH